MKVLISGEYAMRLVDKYKFDLWQNWLQERNPKWINMIKRQIYCVLLLDLNRQTGEGIVAMITNWHVISDNPTHF